jgi:hypothetical protein
MRSLQHNSKNNQEELFTKKALGSAYQSKDAKFLAWQPVEPGKIVALFNITDRRHPSYGSTVTEDTLRNLRLQVPSTPPQPPSFSLFKFPK